MYGLTRSGMNAWMLQQEHKWLQKHQIKYCQDKVGLRKTKLRGFVYSIMNSKFSNSTIKLFRTVMQRKFGEFITVRKPVENLSSNLKYTERNFLGGSGYIVSCKQEQEYLNNVESKTVESLGSKWIALCTEDQKMNVTEIHKMVDELYNNLTNNNSTSTITTTTDGDSDRLDIKLVRKEAVDNLSVQKEPHMILDNWKTKPSYLTGKIYMY